MEKGINMTKFTKDGFDFHGGYLTFNRKFVARFKYGRGDRGTFQTFLIKNFTVEEYFSRLEAGEAPLKIVESKGYILPHIKKWLKEGGYTVDRAGYDRYIKDRVAAVSHQRVG